MLKVQQTCIYLSSGTEPELLAWHYKYITINQMFFSFHYNNTSPTLNIPPSQDKINSPLESSLCPLNIYYHRIKTNSCQSSECQKTLDRVTHLIDMFVGLYKINTESPQRSRCCITIWFSPRHDSISRCACRCHISGRAIQFK